MSPKGRLFFVISVLSLIALAGLYFALQLWMPFMWVIVLTAAVSAGAWLYTDYKLLSEFLSHKSTKQGLSTGRLAITVFVFLGTVNYLAAKYSKSFDFSSNQINSISEQSKNILNSLNSDLEVKYFYKEGVEKIDELKKQARDLVKVYQESSSKVKFEFVEINQKPKMSQEYQVTKGTGELFVSYQDKKNRVENVSEQDLTNAIIKLTRKTNKTICFTLGHGERDQRDEKSDIGFSSARQMLEKNSYTVKDINLIADGKVSSDCQVVIVAAPVMPFQKSEVQMLQDYLKAGGGLMLMLDEPTEMGLGLLLADVGLKLNSHYVYNVITTAMGQVVNAQSATTATDYSNSNNITRLFRNQMSVFRNPHYLEKTEKENIASEVIVKTPQSSVELEKRESKDYLGQPRSFDLAYAATEKKENGFGLVVFADADFASNILLYQNLNRDLFLNSVAALAKESDLISLAVREPMITKMIMAPPEFNQYFKFVFVGLFLPLPFAFLIVGIVLWFRRRHL